MSFFMSNSSETTTTTTPPPSPKPEAEPAAQQTNTQAPSLVEATIPGTDQQMSFYMGTTTSATPLPDGVIRGTMPQDDSRTMTLFARSTDTEAGVACPGGCPTPQNQQTVSQLILTHSARPGTKPRRRIRTNGIGWVSPLANRNCNLDERRYGKYPHPSHGRRVMHHGWDMNRPPGGSIDGLGVVAPFSGKVISAHRAGTCGNMLVVESDDGRYRMKFCHLKGFVPGIRANRRIERGQTVAAVGTTGRSTGPHLHMEIFKNGVHQDPANYYTPQQICRSVE